MHTEYTAIKRGRKWLKTSPFPFLALYQRNHTS
eukprot:UN13137